MPDNTAYVAQRGVTHVHTRLRWRCWAVELLGPDRWAWTASTEAESRHGTVQNEPLAVQLAHDALTELEAGLPYRG